MDVLLSVWSVRNREPSAGRVSPDPILLATGIYFLAGPPAAATPPRTLGARLQSHCRQTPKMILNKFIRNYLIHTQKYIIKLKLNLNRDKEKNTIAFKNLCSDYLKNILEMRKTDKVMSKYSLIKIIRSNKQLF